MADENTATQAKIALRETRRIMLGHRLTYSRIQVRLREAAIEQAEEQVAALQARADALEPLVTADMRRVAELTVEAEEIRLRAVAAALEQILIELTATVGAIGVQVRQLRTDLQTAVAQVERAQRYADTLPVGLLQERVAANEAAERLRAMDELMHLLCSLLSKQEPHDRDETGL
jgi:chromosome segregation ATPase